MLKRIHKAISCTGEAAVHAVEPKKIDNHDVMAERYHQAHPVVSDAVDDGRVGFSMWGYHR